MPKSSVNASLSSYDDIFSTEESRQEEQREQVQQIPIGELFPFKNHPFKVLDDDSMSDTVESVKQYGVLSPLIARPRPKGGYEIISGHRRQHAAELAGLETLPVIVRQMDDDAAIILMVDSNLQREHILPSERAFAYKMKLDAIKNQGTRSDLTSTQVVSKLRSNEKLGAENNQSRETVRRFIRLTNLIPELLDMVDNKTVSFNPAVELSYLSPEQQQEVIRAIPQITTRLEQIDKVLNKLYEDNALGTIPQDRYEQMSQKYSEEYYALKTELSTLQEQLSAYENAGGRAQKFLKLTERHADFTDLTPAILNEFISRIEVHERDQKRARYAIQHISIYFNYIGKFENEVTQLAEPTEQEIRQMREEIEEAKKEKSRAYHRQYSREYRARNLEKQREYDRIKAREYRARRKAQAAAAQSTQ